MQDHHTAYSLL